MFTIRGRSARRLCDRVSRRDFLQVGGLAAAGLSLSDWFRLQSLGAVSPQSRHKSVIMICLGGGPSHIDTYDMKPAAPVDYRGPLRPIATNVPGMEICELFPLQATVADKFSVVRTVQWIEPDHQRAEVFTGYPKNQKHPSFGSLVSRLYRGGSPDLPRFVSLSGEDAEVRMFEDPDYAGAAHRGFVPQGESLADFTLTEGVSLERLGDRRSLLAALDRLERERAAVADDFQGADAFRDKALDLVASNKVRQAFDISLEPQHVRDRYSTGDAKWRYNKGSYQWEWEGFLRARRLAEAGVPYISLQVATWDHHGGNQQDGIFNDYRTVLPLLDRSLWALVTDLEERGLGQDVAVIVWGEFGRTPLVNSGAGRDHWPAAGCAWFAGGGLKMGQMIGQTDRRAEQPLTRIYTPQNILATLYHVLGIDPETTIPDRGGRPAYLLDRREPVAELV